MLKLKCVGFKKAEVYRCCSKCLMSIKFNVEKGEDFNPVLYICNL